jgi:hypothetical protein
MLNHQSKTPETEELMVVEKEEIEEEVIITTEILQSILILS